MMGEYADDDFDDDREDYALWLREARLDADEREAARRPKAEERTEPEARHPDLVKAVEEAIADLELDGRRERTRNNVISDLRAALPNTGEG